MPTADCGRKSKPEKSRPLAVTSAARLTELPDVPTMAEAGVPDYVVTSWNSLYGPKAMPDQAVTCSEPRLDRRFSTTRM